LNSNKHLVIIGGGAAGFMAAIHCAKRNSNIKITIIEQANSVLDKVRISGGGRCNVTHACFDILELIKYYPRGSKELISPFHQFNCQDTIQFFESHQVQLKTEADGRIFPVTNDSMTVVNCLKKLATNLGIQVILQAKVLKFIKQEKFSTYYNDQLIESDFLLIASGSNKSIWNAVQQFNHSILNPVPSLFSFNTKNILLRNLSGISFNSCQVKIRNSNFEAEGALLITHLGLSGPAILKLSAFAAIYLAQQNYQFNLIINWINRTKEEGIDDLNLLKKLEAKKSVGNAAACNLPLRFWQNVLNVLNIAIDKKWAQLTKIELHAIATCLTQCEITIFSKSTNKDEFVTAGGISLAEIDLKTMQSKIVPGLYIVGEALNIDALTGGFNFQAAWTTGFIAGTAIAKSASN
jgi:predicted Rossmann fold flavoprotein